MEEKRITIDMVAQRCGVSKATISRYLNGKYGNISAATRERIQQVIAELDYHPDRTAQRLKSRHSMLIGCIIADISSPFSGLLLKGITGVCSKAGYQVLFADCAEDPGMEANAIHGFIENHVDGLIINTTGGNRELLLDVNENNTPIVLADRIMTPNDPMDSVSSSNRQAARECVEHMHRSGFTRIAFFTEGNRTVSPRVLRYRGYLDAMHALYPGIEPITYTLDRENPSECVRYLIDLRNRFPSERIAIFCVNGMTAQHVLLSLNDAKIALGENLGLCTFDDWTWLQLAPLGITSVSQSSDLIGAEAARLLLARIEAKAEGRTLPVTHKELPVHLRVRKSTQGG